MEAPEVANASVTGTELVKLPPLGVIVGVATVDATGALTIKVNAVVFVTPPPTALTVTVELPAEVAPLVLMASVEEQVGLHEAGEKDAVAPEGSPESEKETDCELPDAKVAVMELFAEDPAVTEIAPELLIEKSKGCVTENKASTSGLALYPFLNAFVFTVALFFTVTVPV